MAAAYLVQYNIPAYKDLTDIRIQGAAGIYNFDCNSHRLPYILKTGEEEKLSKNRNNVKQY